MDLEWIKFGRRKLSPGRPVTFLTTDIFLDYFDLSSTKDLPGGKELRELGLSVRKLKQDYKSNEMNLYAFNLGRYLFFNNIINGLIFAIIYQNKDFDEVCKIV